MINNIGIIGGTGKMGTAFKNAFESIGLEVLISDESSPEKEKNIIKNCDWIILSVPIDQTVSVFNRIKNNISKDQIFSDFTSVKSILSDHVQECEFEFISCHPLFGPLNNFNGQNIVTIQVNTSEKHIYIDKIFKKLELKVTQLKDFEEHDRYMSLIQGMTHFSHVCFTTAMKKMDLDLDKIMDICSPIYQSNISFSSRITGGDENLYTNIIMDNPINKEVIDMYLDTSKEISSLIDNKDYERFKKNFIENRKYLKKHMPNMIDQSNFLVDKMAEFKKGSKDTK